MPTYTPYYHLAKPLVNSAVDQDQWGYELNDDMDILDTTLKSLQDQITALSTTQLPIGSIYMNKTVATNPGTLLGYGTWVAITDKFIVAHGSTYTSTGGAATVTLSQANLPSSATNVTLQGLLTSWDQGTVPPSGSTNNSIGAQQTGSTNSATTRGYTLALGSSAPFDIIPPYQAAYMWERTA